MSITNILKISSTKLFERITENCFIKTVIWEPISIMSIWNDFDRFVRLFRKYVKFFIGFDVFFVLENEFAEYHQMLSNINSLRFSDNNEYSGAVITEWAKMEKVILILFRFRRLKTHINFSHSRYKCFEFTSVGNYAIKFDFLFNRNESFK